jgi:phenylacetic acid degradation protein paaN
VAASRTRGYWSAYPEIASGKIYGETAKADGEAAFKGLLGKPFDLGQPAGKTVGQEVSPLRHAARRHLHVGGCSGADQGIDGGRRDMGCGLVEDRVGACLEIVSRINKQSFLLANAVMHTTGQGFMMAFQAGGPHAQDRALEAIAYAYDEMKRVPQNANWSKPQGKADPLVLDKNWRIVPRGISLVIGCATFPTWNGYPAIFASLATGNSVIVKPHPGAILPLAITVKIAREVLKEAGFDPNVMMLAPDNADAPVTKDLVTHPDVAIVDFTGSQAVRPLGARECRDRRGVHRREPG